MRTNPGSAYRLPAGCVHLAIGYLGVNPGTQGNRGELVKMRSKGAPSRKPQKQTAAEAAARTRRERSSGEIRQRGQDHISGRKPEEQNSAPHQTARHSFQSPLAMPSCGQEQSFPDTDKRRNLLPKTRLGSPRSPAFLGVSRRPNNKHKTSCQFISGPVAAGRQTTESEARP